jgi:hypothetical protein
MKMLVRGPRIVRFLSAYRPDTWRVTRTRKPASRRSRGSAAPPAPSSPTPVPSVELAARVRELRELLDELGELTACGGAWGVRVLRRNLELALLSPETLGSADNQLDFIEELAEAAWDPGDGCLGYPVRAASTPEASWRREERRRAVAERVGEIAHGLCAAAEAWHEGAGNPQDDHSPAPCTHSPSPGSAQPLV